MIATPWGRQQLPLGSRATKRHDATPRVQRRGDTSFRGAGVLTYAAGNPAGHRPHTWPREPFRTSSW